MTRRHSKETILDKFKNIHGYRYDYSNVEYINNHTNVIIICEEHGKFQQSPASHLRGSGCSRCSSKCQGNTTDFLLKVKEIYTDKYDLSLVEYVNASTKVKIICKIHGEFEQIPGNLMKGYSCPECTETKKKNTLEFLQKAKKVHGDEYDYSKMIYKNCNSKVEIICKIHGSFFQQPRIHVTSTGCQKCNNFTTSKIARNWLKSLNIPHLRTFDDPRGEYRIPETKWKVDGYDEKTNTIYEFHGDYWHAHPSVSRYNENEKHPRKRGTWGEIYKKTLEREQKIRNLGYNLIVIWEHEFLASLDNYQGHSALYTN